MNTLNFTQAKNDPTIVRIVNRVFHDVEADSYIDRHPEIYTYEATQWQALIAPLFTTYRQESSQSITLLDIGTGIGFVPFAVKDFLYTTDTVIFSDISSKMLHKAEAYSKDFNFQKQFVLVDPQYSQIKDSSIDFITMNSVLHHIPDSKSLYAQIDRLLKPGGILIIKHEPNILFSESWLLRTMYKSLKIIRSLKQGIRKKESSYSDNTMVLAVTKKLASEEHIEFAPVLSKSELQQIVDIQSPTAGGGIDTQRGFNPLHFCGIYFPTYHLVGMKTYGYFGKIREDRNIMRKSVGVILKTILPNRGYFFDIVIKKGN